LTEARGALGLVEPPLDSRHRRRLTPSFEFDWRKHVKRRVASLAVVKISRYSTMPLANATRVFQRFVSGALAALSYPATAPCDVQNLLRCPCTLKNQTK
jgi:hypothetical protein